MGCVFERFEESTRVVVVTAQEEARALQHEAIGGEHLILGISEQDPILFNVRIDALRNQVIDLFGRGNAPLVSTMPFTPTATRSLELAVEEALSRGHERVRPAHLLVALLREDEHARAVVQASGRSVEAVVDLAEAASGRSPTRAPQDVHQAPRQGYPVTVSLGDGLPVGDLGHPRTDARILRAMLAADGKAAKLLRKHGVDEATVRQLHPRTEPET